MSRFDAASDGLAGLHNLSYATPQRVKRCSFNGLDATRRIGAAQGGGE